MGASHWVSYTPYQEDLEQAFQALRQHVFETNNYDHFWQLLELERLEKARCAERDIDPSDRHAVEQLLQETGPLVVPPAKTIDEVRQKSAGEGTHSVLDISRLITDSRYYGGVPLPQEILRQFFQNEEPTKEVVEAIVFQEEIWSRVLFSIMHPGVFHFSEEVHGLVFLEETKHELVEALLTRENVWRELRRCIRFHIESLAIMTRVGVAMPFSEEDVVAFFGRAKPTRAAVEATFEQGEIWGIMRRGVGYYVIIYQDELPCEIAFAGITGD